MILVPRRALTLATYATLLAALACAPPAPTTRTSGAAGASVSRAAFGRAPDGKQVDVFTLRNANGLELRAITYGGIITAFRTPDRDGRFDDIVLGFENLEGYLRSSPYFGALVGRYANRIQRAQFSLDGTTHRLAANNGPNHLHGGLKGFDKVVWDATPIRTDSGVGVDLRYTSADGEEGYPGTLRMHVSYTLNDRDELVVVYNGTTDRATPVNLSQHSYWNLAGSTGREVLGHELMINADSLTPVDSTLIPTGEITPVEGTPFDFRRLTAIGARIGQSNVQLKFGRGYDHNFVLKRNRPNELVHAARVVEPTTGRSLDIHTTEPGMQFYSGNFLDGSLTGKGVVYRHRTGLALETQHYPDSPNKPQFPSVILRPGATYHSRTVFKVGVVR